MKNNLKFYRTLFFIYIIIVLILSVIPSPEGFRLGGDKTKHVAAFVMFTWLFFVSYKETKYVYIFLWGLSFGILIEFIQYFIPWRSTEALDVLADVGGIAIGFILIKMVNMLKQKSGIDGQ